MKYETLVTQIIEGVGGTENIESAVHCATRLRFKLRDESKANDDTVNNIDGVLTVVKAGGQYQVVIGQHVADVYKDLMAVMGPNTGSSESSGLKDAKEFKKEMSKKKVSSSFIDIISGVFTPILGMLTASGVIKGVLALLNATGILAADSGTYQILSIVGDCFFYYMPVFLGYTAMKKFGGSPFIGMAIGAALVYPSIATIMAQEPLYTLFVGTIFETPVYLTFLGIPVLLMNYASSVIPVIVTCFFAAKIERFFDEKISPLFKTFAVPALTMLLSIICAFLIIGPVITFCSNILGAAFSMLFALSPVISGFLYGALIQVCVMFGIHWGFVALSINNLATMGYDPITIAGMTSGFSLAGVVLVIMLLTKNKKVKSVCGPAILSSLVGITEPAIYGVVLQYKKPFALACLATGVGGAMIGMGEVKQYFYGTNGIFGWLQVINPETGFDSSVVWCIAACIVSFVLAVILMLTVGRSSIPDTSTKDTAAPKTAPNPEKTIAKTQNLKSNSSHETLAAPVHGNMIPIESVKDEVFASKSMGDGVAFELLDNPAVVTSPLSGTLSVVYPTGHAFGITGNDGKEVLIHIGIDTVNAQGKGFILQNIKQGDAIKQGQPLVRVDANALKDYDLTVMLIVTNPNGEAIEFKAGDTVHPGDSIEKK